MPIRTNWANGEEWSAANQNELNTAVLAAEVAANKGAAGGYCGLDGSARIAAANLPTTAVTTTGEQNVSLGTVTPQSLNVSSVGYTGMPAVSQTANYTLVAGDAGDMILHPSTDNNPRTFTIPANSSVAFPVGTVVTFVNAVNTLTIAITSDTMTLAGTSTTGSRTLAANGIATAIKTGATAWLISGVGLT